MILESIKLKNFRGYKTETIIPISSITAFIGKNDAGKSSILEALEIFFNNSTVVCEKDDLNIEAIDKEIEITCVFSNFPEKIIIDSTSNTSLKKEYLLNNNSKLEIKKVFTATSAKPKEKIFIICNHPLNKQKNDLMTLKKADLIKRAAKLGVPKENYNGNINSSIRSAIWNFNKDLELNNTALLVDKEDTKKVYEALKKYLPLYALFQSDRQSKDDDKEVTDPMKVAVKQALAELTKELDKIKEEVQKKAIETANKTIETANKTLEKLKEMSPNLANELIPEFKTEPKFDSNFKLTIKSEEGIPINKRGSGVRRLILLSFFRAEAERLRTEKSEKKIIFAFEEPETSQHPDHQKMLIQAFLDLANSKNSQVILTTHTPALGSLLPLESLRFIEKNGNDRIIQSGTEEVFNKISKTLGVLPDPIPKKAKAILLLEGQGDIFFIKHTEEKLKIGGYINQTLTEKGIVLVPMGGCGNLKHWITLKLIEQFELPYCVLIDSDKGTPEEARNFNNIQKLKNDGIKAYLTRKREPENYINIEVLSLPPGSTLTYTDSCDAKKLIAKETNTKNANVLEKYWTKMSLDQIRKVETYEENGEEKFEFTDMFEDFLSIVS